MSVTYTHNGPLTLSGLIGFVEKIQDERKSDQVVRIESETVIEAMKAFGGKEVTAPSHTLSITVRGPGE